MPRTKGSKNKTNAIASVDYAALIAEKNAAGDALADEIAALGTNIAELNIERKNKQKDLKRINKEITKLEAKKAYADQKAVEAAAEKEAIDLVKKALANGTTVDDILELLK